MTENTNLPIPSNNNQTLDWLETRISAQIDEFKGKRNFYRKKSFQFTLTIAGLSAVTTILVGLSQSDDKPVISAIALITSAVTSFVTAWESLYASRQRWIKNNETLVRFYGLRDDITKARLQFNDQVTLEKLEDFYTFYKKILNDANQQWQEDRRDE